jgi:hypothetical protein
VSQTDEVSSMSSLRGLMRSGMACGVAAALLWALCPAAANAQSVRGQGELDNGPNLSPSHITVDAWLDASGGVHGKMTWIGDISNVPPYADLGPAGPADPWLIDVTDLVFDGDTAYVAGVVSHSVFPTDIGRTVIFTFTDNSDLGLPDEINGEPIVAGNFTVDD